MVWIYVRSSCWCCSWCNGFYRSFAKSIVETYTSLCEATSEGGSGSSIQANFGRKYGWFQSIYTLAKEDAAKIDDAVKLNVHRALLVLEYEKDKNRVEVALIKRAHNKNK